MGEFDSQNVEELIEQSDLEEGSNEGTVTVTYSTDSVDRFGWWPNFGFSHRWSVNIPADTWRRVTEYIYVHEGKLVIYEADPTDDFLDMLDIRSRFDM